MKLDTDRLRRTDFTVGDRLDRTWLPVSELAVGTWRFDRRTAEGTLETDCGATGAAEALL